ncbi:hypothetical protein GCM10027614_78740 [Micromonospora vulcania]
MTHSEAVDWPDVSVPGTVYPAALADTYPDEATIGGPVYWAARPHHPGWCTSPSAVRPSYP